ncbi:MAG TPA: TonB-dependent receptor [Steroidobacteraceae bacterium]|jgi:iron complex outermembrane receptor protein|nr:TonB-dependent receptor [Steroidobacteraceae bacterium]
MRTRQRANLSKAGNLTATPARGWLRRREPVTALTAAVLTALYGARALAAAGDAGDDNVTPTAAPTSLDEVIVTASRRAVQAEDLPISITAVTGDSLQQAGIQDIADLAHSIAGISYADKGPFSGVNGSTLIIRGLNSEATAGQLALATPVVPPVATYLDDTPLFFSLRLQDLDHVEVLRGPQGTLYGSGSLGGTIRFVQNAPDLSGFDARAEVTGSDTARTHEPNGDVNGMLNFALSDALAVRLNAGLSYDAGFINQPDLYVLNSKAQPISADPTNLLSPPLTYSRAGTNEYEYKNGRLAVLWKPNDDFHAQLSYFYQLSTADGFPYDSVLFGLNNLSSSDHTQAHTNDQVNLVSLTLEENFGFATLTSNTSWSHHVNRTDSDLTDLYADFPFYPSLYGSNPRVLVTGHDKLDDKPITEEIRLASATGGFFDWVGGLFYKHETTDIQEHEFYPGYFDYFNACVPVYGVSNGDGVTPSKCGIGETVFTPGTNTFVDGIPIVEDQAYIGDFETKYTDLAAFGELTAHLTSAWSVTGGARVFRQTVEQAQQTGLLFDGPISIDNNSLSNAWNKALWKLNSSYQLDKTNLIYATWSQGFRRGGVNALPPQEPAVNYVTNPGLYKVSPDTADNYEIGVKGTIANRFRYSADIFEIQWHHVQEGAQLTPLVLPASVNLGDAYSQGFESELYWAPDDHFTVQADYTYDHTRVSTITALAIGGLAVPPPLPGGPLPGTPKNSAALTLGYGHLDAGPGAFRAELTAHYQSSLLPAVSSTIPTVPGYTTLEARLSYQMPHWELTLFGTNLTNVLGINSFSDPTNYQQFYQALITPPRTIGLTLAYSFREK